MASPDSEGALQAMHSIPCEIKWHPSFASPDTDVILCSNDDTAFRVYSHTLKTTSGLFASMFSLPRNTPHALASDIIRLDEDANVLASLLKMVSGMDFPPLVSIDFVDALLRAAEKYDMPGPASIIRNSLPSPLLEGSPIRIYGIAYRQGWFKEAAEVSRRTLGLDLCSPDVSRELAKIDAAAVVKLFELRRKRMESMVDCLNDHARFNVAGDATSICKNCSTPLQHVKWRSLQCAWALLVEKNGLTDEAIEIPEVVEACNAECTKCQERMYNETVTLRALRSVIKALPLTIELP
ncbi:hypothetical protein WOLCODRAFT_160180 [Wolfiporia cocos MD-104 SS10]|uniref:BTB domain-containing protein n=1 Tax=Wolfiporia cocos (strain MD-104) TaxID=742152 RepID=A0A2H3JC93_WOLCO|nr:hypothetical protein WOLCODRAFT_160180 [Wolfiporia cocos MD-104 SS10]